MDRARLRALDGLRALSVLGVFFSGYHFVAPFGWIGVLVFYVLSGFLITRILLGERASARQQSLGALTYFKRFHVRRVLRIFPLYLAYLLALELAHGGLGRLPSWPEVRPFAFGYAVNFGMLLRRVPINEYYGHLWTLSVEEQFYVVWPLLVWLLSRKSLLRVALALVALGPVVRLFCRTALGFGVGDVYVSSFSHLDAFAVGAVLATHDFARIERVKPLALGALGVTLATGVTVALATGAALRTLGLREGLPEAFGYVWGFSLLDLTAGALILAALRGELPLLEHRTLAYVGKISYGIYLVQRPLKHLYLTYAEPQLFSLLHSRALVLPLGALLCIGGSIAIAALSYHAFELPILRVRDRLVPPRRETPTREALAA